VHQDPFAGFKPRVVEQHVFDRGISDCDAGGIAQGHAIGDFRCEARRMVGKFLREAIDVEAAHAGDVLAEVLAAARAGRAGATDQGGVGNDAVARLDRGDPVANRDHFAGGLGADAKREQTLCEGHAAKAPYVDMVQPDVTDTELYFIGGGRGRGFGIDKRDLAVSKKAESTHCRICHCEERSDAAIPDEIASSLRSLQ
jgi:hypothetical protein